MALKGWNQAYSVGHSLMDEDHRKLVSMISNLYEAMRIGQSKTVVAPLIQQVDQYAKEHFRREEEYLQKINSSAYNDQKNQHTLFLNKVQEFKTRYESGTSMLALEMLPFLNEWFMNHILKTDMQYKAGTVSV